MRARTPWHSRQISRHDDFLPDRISESVAEAGRRDIAPFQGDGEEGAESEHKTSALARRLTSGLRETRLPPFAKIQGTMLTVQSTVQVYCRWRLNVLLSASDFDWYKPIGQPW